MFSVCKGKGMTGIKINKILAIPKGTRSGDKIKIKKMGNCGGDLIIKVSEIEHPLFKRDNYDIHSHIKLTKDQITKGGKFAVETLNGKLDIDIPKNILSSTTVLIPMAGVHHSFPNQHLKGDHIVHIKIK